MLYQNLITQSLYDKQLDSGRGTLLHICDDVIQQEVRRHLLSKHSSLPFFLQLGSYLLGLSYVWERHASFDIYLFPSDS